MKKIITVVFSVLLLTGVVSENAAAFDFGELLFIVYDNPGHGTTYSPIGQESAFNLGHAGNFAEGLVADNVTWDTGISFTDFSGADDWDDLYVGIVGGYKTSNVLGLFYEHAIWASKDSSEDYTLGSGALNTFAGINSGLENHSGDQGDTYSYKKAENDKL